MRIENTGLEQLQLDLRTLDDIMEQYGLTRDGHWDYERVTYDRKFTIGKNVYYLRVQGVATEGDVGANRAIIQLKTPILGKHYPHGVEYGEDENFPQRLSL